MTSFCVGLLALLCLYLKAEAILTNQYKSHYESLVKTIANELREFDRLTDLIMLNSAIAIRDKLNSGQIADQRGLIRMISESNVDEAHIIDKTGRFILSSNGFAESTRANLFDYCKNYEGLVTGASPLEQTPIILTPTGKPEKFTMLPTASGKYIVEVGMMLNFIEETLSNTVTTYKEIGSISLTTPSNKLLGQIQRTRYGDEHSMHFREIVQGSMEQCCECKNKNLTDENGRYYYVLSATISAESLLNKMNQLRLFIVSILIVLSSACWVLSRILTKRLVGRLRKLEEGLDRVGETGDLTASISVRGRDEISKIVEQFNGMIVRLNKNQNRLIDAEKNKAVAHIASQVAHDIRSPLAALNIAIQSMQGVPEEVRILIRSALQRINDIANQLALKKTKRAEDKQSADEPSETTLLSPVIESLVSEKRIQYKAFAGITIESNLSNEACGMFSRIQPGAFKRVLSNLINNSIDAFENESGIITLSMTVGTLPDDERQITIIVADNGKGISPEVLPKLMQRGATYGKEGHDTSGTGLGLYHAKETIRSWGGNIMIESEIGKGTRVVITLPQQPAPHWFLQSLSVGISESQHRIIILDDDDSIHGVWEKRLVDKGIHKNDIVHFTNSEAFLYWHHECVSTASIHQSLLYLFDYELFGSKLSGLDVIEKLGIAKEAVLVTSRYEDETVLKKCKRLGVKLLPKNMAGFVPIDILR